MVRVLDWGDPGSDSQPAKKLITGSLPSLAGRIKGQRIVYANEFLGRKEGKAGMDGRRNRWHICIYVLCSQSSVTSTGSRITVRKIWRGMYTALSIVANQALLTSRPMEINGHEKHGGKGKQALNGTAALVQFCYCWASTDSQASIWNAYAINGDIWYISLNFPLY